MNASLRFRPIAARRADGRFDVYVGATYSALPREAALTLFTQLGAALGIACGEGVAMFAARVLHAHRGDAPRDVGDIDGGTLQDFAVAAELVEWFARPANGCGPDCYCEVGDRCLRLSGVGTALMAMLDAEGALREVRP